MLLLRDEWFNYMTRKREFNPNVYYHVIMHGNNRQNIFGTKEDMFELLQAFQHVHIKFPFTILAYCFMTNHYHILIKPVRDHLANNMDSSTNALVLPIQNVITILDVFIRNVILPRKLIVD